MNTETKILFTQQLDELFLIGYPDTTVVLNKQILKDMPALSVVAHLNSEGLAIQPEVVRMSWAEVSELFTHAQERGWVNPEPVVEEGTLSAALRDELL